MDEEAMLQLASKAVDYIFDASPNVRTVLKARLILSIDRRETTEQALATVKLAAAYKTKGVVGIDLSGNPSIGEWATFVPALRKAQQQGLKVTLHAGEVTNSTEIKSMLEMQPDRLGHVCTFTDDELESSAICLQEPDYPIIREEPGWPTLVPALMGREARDIPIELCPTSNLRTESVK
eukprot:gene15279-18076_t